MPSRAPRVAVLGAGPIGLDAALACVDAGLPVTVYEAGDAVGAHVRAWGHVRLFTPWAMNTSPRMRAHHARHHTTSIGDGCPTGAELDAQVLQPIARSRALHERIKLRHKVVAIAREGLLKHEDIAGAARAAAPFRLLLDTPDGEQETFADVVVDCTGTYGTANALGDGGIPAPGERALTHRITRTLPRVGDPGAWSGTVLLVGAGKSAQTAARELAALPGTRLHWLVRNAEPTWGEVPHDTLPARQELVDSSRQLTAGHHRRVTVHTGTRITALGEDAGRIRASLVTTTGPGELAADYLIALTGYVGDPTIYRQLQVHECYATGAPMNLSAAVLGAASADCLAQPVPGADTLRNPEPDFYLLGAKSYGRMNTFLLRTGYEQVDHLQARLRTSRV